MPRSQWSTTRLDLVGVNEAAEILGVDRRTIARWCETGSGTKGPDRTYMPPWVEIGKTKIWTRADVARLADQRRDRVAIQRELQASIRGELVLDSTRLAVIFIEWKGTAIAMLSAENEDGTGGWSVQPTPLPGHVPLGHWHVGNNRAAARTGALDLVAKRLAQNLAAGVDPHGPHGFLGAAQSPPGEPEPAFAPEAFSTP